MLVVSFILLQLMNQLYTFLLPNFVIGNKVLLKDLTISQTDMYTTQTCS